VGIATNVIAAVIRPSLITPAGIAMSQVPHQVPNQRAGEVVIRTSARVAARELLPATYYHLVFSVPHKLVPLMWQNQKVLFKLLFEASAETLLEVAADPQRLGAEIGFLSVLHTWVQSLQPHPHVHCVVPGGGLSRDHQRWIPSSPKFFLPVKVLSEVFRGKFLDGLRRAFRSKRLAFHGSCHSLESRKAFYAFLETLREHDWVVYAKKPFGGDRHSRDVPLEGTMRTTASTAP
jgi:hypothetical protein